MTPRALVFFDGGCGLCCSTVERMRRSRAAAFLDFANARDPGVLLRYPEIDPSRAMERIQLLVPGEPGPRQGFDAVLWIAMQLPEARRWGWILKSGLVRWVGRRVYDGVARRRERFSGCAGRCGMGKKA